MSEILDDIRHAKLLIIDDEEANLELLEELFAEEGFEQVISSFDALKVSSLIQGFRPDIILLDLRMPDVDGFEVLRLLDDLRTQGDWIPVVVLTADITKQARYEALSLGASDFLTKPFDRLEVVLRVWNLLETRRFYLRLKALGEVTDLSPHGPWQS
ncbi:MAG: putative response regulator [Marinobacter excellens HL-55]|uniref:Putative response regulator n=1 Tax=Marinobacter excellens HL-55 TaxID=1305731 RepID=A0A0P7Z5T3_9GAMM|nr:MAG: putative response regulator [Marinobacter excellens HL-55]